MCCFKLEDNLIFAFIVTHADHLQATYSMIHKGASKQRVSIEWVLALLNIDEVSQSCFEL